MTTTSATCRSGASSCARGSDQRLLGTDTGHRPVAVVNQSPNSWQGRSQRHHPKERSPKPSANPTRRRRGGKLHHIGLGTEHAGAPVKLLIHDLNILVIDTTTGEIIRELTLDPERNYHGLGRKPGPPKGSPHRGGRGKKEPQQ